MKIGIIITGIISDYFLEELINQYIGCHYTKIISTWNDIDTVIIDKLKINGFHVTQNVFPNDIHRNSVNYQNLSAIKGIEYAEQIHFCTHVIRVRADMYCNNINLLLKIYQDMYQEDKIIFFLHLHNYTPGYLIDYGHFGNIKDTLQYVGKFQLENDTRFPELFRQDICYNTNDFGIINTRVIYSGEKLLENNIDFCFLKKEHHTDSRKDLINSYIEYNNLYGFYSF